MHAGNSVTRVYATSLMELGAAQGSLSEVQDDLKIVVRALEDNSAMRNLYESPKVGRDDKRRLLEAIFREKVHVFVFNLLLVLVEKGRETLLKAISQELEFLRDLAELKLHVNVTSAAPLSDDLRGLLMKKLIDVTGATVILHESVDENLIGGFVVKAGDKVLDASLRTGLGRLRRALETGAVAG